MTLGGIDLNLLVALDALLTEQNVTRAAERLSVGQPAMSASLARLRRHFDDPLLVREGRGMRPTPLAVSLVEPVREAIAAAELVMARTAGFDPARDARSFTMIASDYVTMVLLRPLLAALGEEAPNVRLTVRQVDSGFADHLRRGSADMVVLPTELVGDRFDFPRQLLFTDRYVLAVAQSNTKVGEWVTVDEFLAIHFVAYAANSMTPIADIELRSQGLKLRVDVTTQEFVVAPFLLAGTQLATLVLERLGTQLAGPANLRLLESPVPLRPIHEAIFWHPRHTDDPAHRWLRERLFRLASDL